MIEIVDHARVELPELLDDLQAEYAAVDGLLVDLPDSDVTTPADGWGIRETIAHLVQGEELAALAAERPDEFRTELARLLEDLAASMQEFERWSRTAPVPELAERWREGRERLVTALTAVQATDRIPWVTGDMAAASFTTARVMEAWAHGLDIADGLGRERPDTDVRLRHVVHLGIRTRGFAFRNRGLEVPDAPWRLQLASPGGATWVHGPVDAGERISGPAADFAAVVTQRRHPQDTDLIIEGAGVRAWMDIAQCYAGPATDHRPPGTFADGVWTARVA